MELKIYLRVLALAALLAADQGVPTSGAAASSSSAAPPRGYITIDSLSSRFAPVLFDHELHDSYAACVECHHHTLGEPPSDLACASCHRTGVILRSTGCVQCHPRDRFAKDYLQEQDSGGRYHIDTPGLVGAYHLNCIGCHEIIGTGPTDCEGCHEKN